MTNPAIQQLTKFSLPNHPDIEDFLQLIAFGQTVGHGEQGEKVIISGGTGQTFTFVRRSDGSYLFERYQG